MRNLVFLIVSLNLLLVVPIAADGLKDNHPENVRRVPPLGIEVPADVREELEAKLAEIDRMVAAIRQAKDKRLIELLPDVEIFTRAVRSALTHQEFFNDKEFEYARVLLREGRSRAKMMIETPNELAWTTQSGLVVRGFRSKIDHTPQPYGLVLPTGANASPKRLDIWFHGRGERTSEVGFIYQRMTKVGQYAPNDTIVLHPYGRYSNAFKFAGEVDVLEALESTQQRYKVDPDRISVRGFSMGGAACWQFAVHYPDRWFAANPGAGFSETPEFLKFFQKETLKPTWYEKKLWQLHDCNGYAKNLASCPTIAYSGELDIQKQAADVMQEAMSAADIDLVHVIGPNTKHSIHPDSKIEIERRMAQLAQVGRERTPKRISFQTFTLKYNRMFWLTVDQMEEHWQKAEVNAQILSKAEGSAVRVSATNVAAVTLDFPAGTFNDVRKHVEIQIDECRHLVRPLSDRSLHVSLVRKDGNWSVGAPSGLRKKHNLQGPIDDAFMDSFIFVRPSGDGDSVVDRWVEGELDHAITHWRQHFRGEARVKADNRVTEEDIASSNLVLFGTPKTNALIAELNDRLPIQTSDGQVVAGSKSFDATTHAPIFVYPNPKNPERYVVLNSSFTYREYAYLNNARQVPMLPDWAIVDVRSGATSQYPGKVVAADFFDEQWRLKSN